MEFTDFLNYTRLLRLPEEAGIELWAIRERITELIPRSCELVCYSTLFGKADRLPSLRHGLFPVLVISDQNSCSYGYEIIRTSLHLRNPRLTAKVFKILPHLVFPDQEYSIYFDANCWLNWERVSELIEAVLSARTAMNVFHHNRRNCVYKELVACAVYGKDSVSSLFLTLCRLLRDGYPLGKGLIQGGFLVRRHTDKQVQEVMNDWWLHIISLTERDQILFNYVAWKHGFEYGVIPGKLHCSDFTYVHPHESHQFDKNGRLHSTMRSRFWAWVLRLKKDLGKP